MKHLSQNLLNRIGKAQKFSQKFTKSSYSKMIVKIRACRKSVTFFLRTMKNLIEKNFFSR